jgi:phage terminase small subunit
MRDATEQLRRIGREFGFTHDSRVPLPLGPEDRDLDDLFDF